MVCPAGSTVLCVEINFCWSFGRVWEAGLVGVKNRDLAFYLSFLGFQATEEYVSVQSGEFLEYMSTSAVLPSGVWCWLNGGNRLFCCAVCELDAIKSLAFPLSPEMQKMRCCFREHQIPHRPLDL